MTKTCLVILHSMQLLTMARHPRDLNSVHKNTRSIVDEIFTACGFFNPYSFFFFLRWFVTRRWRYSNDKHVMTKQVSRFVNSITDFEYNV